MRFVVQEHEDSTGAAYWVVWDSKNSTPDEFYTDEVRALEHAQQLNDPYGEYMEE